MNIYNKWELTVTDTHWKKGWELKDFGEYQISSIVLPVKLLYCVIDGLNSIYASM